MSYTLLNIIGIISLLICFIYIWVTGIDFVYCDREPTYKNITKFMISIILFAGSLITLAVVGDKSDKNDTSINEEKKLK